MTAHVSFPDIEQFRHLIRNVTSRAQYAGQDALGEPVYDTAKSLPTLQFSGTVKLHGTNVGVGLNRLTGEIWFQSREVVLANEDLHGIKAHFAKHNILSLFADIPGDIVVVFGEWCGKGIQKGCAIHKLEKRLVVFAANSDGRWLTVNETSRINDPLASVYNIYDYGSYSIYIDFNLPTAAQPELERIVKCVEDECPVGSAFGVKGTGEGIVWRCVTPGWENPKFWMKTKGEKHAIRATKEVVPVDVEKVASQDAFVAAVLSVARLEQGVEHLRQVGRPLDRTSLGEYLRWIVGDVVKEESDTAAASGIQIKEINGKISAAARTWFFANEATFN